MDHVTVFRVMREILSDLRSKMPSYVRNRVPHGTELYMYIV